MKFTCDSCNAQYMISDDKVGPTGVKVRCKKCGHVITVRRSSDAEAAGVPAAAAPPATGDGLDAELGSAFDSAFGDKPPAPAPAPDLDATQAMSPEDAKRIAGAAGPSTEWYVAIGEAQVGPLPIADVKRKWEQGDVGPDSLVWRPGMGDWSPLSTVSELASVLSPIPRPAPRAAAPAPAAPRTGTPALGTPAVAPAPAAAAAPAPDVNWKPAGASALAALASEELQARAPSAAPEPAKPAAPKPGGARSLVEQMNLADQGGVEPTGALPLSIKGVERTDESPIRRKSSVAARQEEVRQKRGNARLVIGILGAVVVVVAGAAFGVVTYLGRKAPEVAQLQPPSTPPAPPPQAAPPPVAPPPAAQPAAPAPAPAVAVAPPAPAAEPEPAPAPAPKAAAAKGAPAKAARAAPPPPPARTTVARREEPEPPPPPPKAKAKGDLLDELGGGDDALADALGGGGSGRSVYVPPKPGGTASLPDQVSDGQITEGIKGKFDALAGCGELNTGAAAVIVMRWSITAEGGTRDVKCAAPCGNQAVANCLAPIIKSIRFPRSVNGRARVEFPFKF